MAYSVQDFAESLARTGEPTLDEIRSVVAAWGGSEEGFGEWSGGFLLELKDGRYAYLSGWCDTSGWGCQDDAYISYTDTRPELGGLNHGMDELGETAPPAEWWDILPADLNRYLAGVQAGTIKPHETF